MGGHGPRSLMPRIASTLWWVWMPGHGARLARCSCPGRRQAVPFDASAAKDAGVEPTGGFPRV